MKEFQNIKDDFPIFEREINSKRLTYLDSGATSQKPKTVIEAMSNIYINKNLTLQNSDNKNLSTSDRRRLAVKGRTNSTRQKINR